MSNYFIINLHNGVRTIQINKPQVRNALDDEMYNEYMKIVLSDANNDEVRATIITGTGNIFSSGNDFSQAHSGSIDMKFIGETTENLGKVLIDYPKLLIAVVNGPAIGVAAAWLGLYDIVYASDRANFSTPFVRYGVCPDAAASYTLPRCIGRSMASEMAFFGRTITAQEALNCGLVAKVIPHENLPEFIQSLYKIGDIPLDTIISTKELIMAPIKKKLHEAHKREFAKLREIFSSSEVFDIIVEAFVRRSKL